MRFAWAVFSIVLPASLRRRFGNRFLGWDVHPTAYVGRSIILVRHLKMGAGASIGPLNVIRHLERLELGEGASIATRNWITGWPLSSDIFQNSPNRDPSLIMGKHSSITVAHDIDCCDRFEVGDHAALAGFRCAVITHNLDLVRDRFLASPVVIGERSAVMSGCTLLSGSKVPARSIISAGSVITTPLTKELTLYRGNPAEPVRDLPDTLKFFHRDDSGASNPTRPRSVD